VRHYEGCLANLIHSQPLNRSNPAGQAKSDPPLRIGARLRPGVSALSESPYQEAKGTGARDNRACNDASDWPRPQIPEMPWRRETAHSSFSSSAILARRLRNSYKRLFSSSHWNAAIRLSTDSSFSTESAR
jgi:hypothetical protein